MSLLVLHVCFTNARMTSSIPRVITSVIITRKTTRPIALLVYPFTSLPSRAQCTSGTMVNGTLTESIIRLTISVLAGPPVNYNITRVGISAIIW